MSLDEFERNEHGHIVLTITGLDLTGRQEIRRLKDAGFRVSNSMELCLTSEKYGGYDKHRLVAAQQYKIALMPTKEIIRDAGRTTDGLREHAAENYGYTKPLAGIAPRIFELLSGKLMEEMGFSYIIILHNPIKDDAGDPGVLNATRWHDGLWLCANWVYPVRRWDGCGAFAFLAP